ncbi:MAG: class I SAM-dependent methyltransferase [Phycisphaerae bacterium]
MANSLPPLDPTLSAKHWWFRGRTDCVTRMAEGLGISRKSKVLDIGCSDGAIISALLAAGFVNVSGIDAAPDAIHSCNARGLSNVQVMDPTAPTLPQNAYDLLIASDLLNHLEFPGIALENWRRLLKPDGKLIVFVPAYQILWSSHDVVHGHFRRYTRARLLEELRIAEFSILTSGYWNTTPLPVAAAIRISRTLRGNNAAPPQSDLRLPKPSLNRALERILRFENAALRSGFRAPFGLSTWAIAGLPGESADTP